MLERLKGKRVSIGVAFIGGTNTGFTVTLGGTKYFEGIIVDFDENFIVFDNNDMIGIKFIQTIEVL